MTKDIHPDSFVKPGFEKVVDAFLSNFQETEELGASTAVYKDGELVADIWGGWVDEDKRVPWAKDTLVNVWSCTKGLVSTSIHLLISRGKLSLSDPISKHWPELSGGAKDRITLQHVLTHRSGIVTWQSKEEVNLLYEWDRAVGLLAEQEVFWEPGEQSGYHLFTFGHLLGELIRRVDGRTVSDFIQQELARPLELDFHMPLPREHLYRVSDIYLMPTTTQIPDSARQKLPEIAKFAFTNPLARVYDANSQDWRDAVIPAANGHCTARDLAKLYGLISNGGQLGNLKMFEPADVERMREPAPSGVDLVLGPGMKGKEMVWGHGYHINSNLFNGSNPRAFYQGGFGGSLGFCDPDQGIGFGYTMNRMDLSSRSSNRASKIVESLYSAI